ncbi:hypothetical protein pdam_00020093 [Pocillopora damicornis]|uniref:Cyclin-D-binding Myb-like transcription factor 1 n=1 Tax=Pocillopora damicornis TaxID=46731 RepID=A0A3M6UJR5_POCDA|nr:hypothetical protein pdam_00020093 [Pocillopora damicornis]
MEVDGTNTQDELSGVSLQHEAACTVDAKALEENGGDLAFTPTFSPDGPVTTLAELSGVKRKHTDQTDEQVNKHLHLDPESSDGFADLATLVSMSSSVSLAVSQEVASQTFTNATIDNTGQLAPLSAQEAANATLTLSAAVAALAAGQLTQESSIVPASQPVVVSDNNNSVNQAWFTTKEDKDNLHGKGVKWRQGMWSKEENEQLKENILEYCKVNNIPDPNIIIFEMTKDDRKDFYRTIAKGIRRPLFAIYRRVLRMYDRRNYIGKYSSEEVEQLKSLKEKHGNDWATIGAAMGRSASSVKDRFRLMREHCHSGKWTVEEEQRLSNAVHELSSAASGDFITAGISWAAVAERVGTRSEKQCRSKWLNYLNWKEKGGQEWTKQDEIQLITRIHEMNLQDENDLDWQWLRSKWWALKKHVPESDMGTFEVTSDGTVSREDDTSPLTTSHNRFEVVQVNALTPQDMFHTASAVQGTPSYIIQAPAGQTYIIQQPAGSLVRQAHTGELTSGSDGIDTSQHDQEVVTVLQAHHAVQTLPEVGPEFTQAIVQTDISGPITASELTNAGLSHTKFVKPAADLQTSVVSQGDGSHATVDQTSLEAVQTVDTRQLGGHQSLVQDELQVEASNAKEGGSKQTALPHHPTSGRDEDSNVASTNQAFTSPPFQGPAAIAQTLDGTHLPDRPVVHMHQVGPENRDVIVSPDPLGDVHVTVMSNIETGLPATLSPSPAMTLPQHTLSRTSNANELSVNVMVPQVTLPDEILQSQSDEPSVLSPAESTNVMMVTENPMSVTSTLPSQILQSQTDENTNLSDPTPTSNSTVPTGISVDGPLGNVVTVQGALGHPGDIMDASDVLLHISLPISDPSVTSEKQDCSTET